ncbi:MAG: hypothetical protein ABIQ32_05415 [Sphingomicrobium sp.]
MLRVVGIGLAVLALSACGSGGGSGGNRDATTTVAKAGVTACDILKAEDVERVLGRPVKKLDATGGAGALDICQYGYQGEKLLDMGQASVTLHGNSLAEMKTGVEREGYDTEEIADLGDRAFWSMQSGLYVEKGGRTALYLVGANGMKDSKAPSIALARATVDRM